MARKYRKKVYSSIIIVVLSISGYIYNSLFKETLNSNDVTLANCVDGDTARFIINGKQESVRFLGINTPEIAHGSSKDQPYGQEAKKYTCDALQSAKKITLEYEAAKTDKYGRTLAWIFVDGKLLNEELVRQGYAKVAYLYDKYQYTNILKVAEKKAKNEKLNIWK